MFTVIEKVMALQNVDVFAEVPTEPLSHLALISEEALFQTGETVYREADPPTAMYLILEGRVRLHRGELEVTVAGPGEVFGTWSLFDDEPMVVTATSLEAVRLLRIDKEDFVDLLADHVEITQGILKGMTRRLHSLVGRVRRDSGESP